MMIGSMIDTHGPYVRDVPDKEWEKIFPKKKDAADVVTIMEYLNGLKEFTII